LPSRTPARSNWLFYAVGIGALLAVGAGIAAILYFRPEGERADVLTHTVKRGPLEVSVTEKGTLESAENRDVICRVKAGTKGFATTINWVIDDGSIVEAGKLLMILDDSALQDQSRQQKVVVDEKLALKITADKQYDITVKENERLIAEAENALLVAEIDLRKYTGIEYDRERAGIAAVLGIPTALTEGGEYQRLLDDLTGQVRLAESDVEQNRERSAWADRMVKQKYMSPAQAQAERSRLDSSLEKLRGLRSQRDLLMSYDRTKTLADFRSKVDNARRMVEQKKLEADAKRVQAEIDRTSKASIFYEEQAKLQELADQIKECRIHAPQAGMVVYFRNESRRFGSTPDGLIEQGAQVKEGQKLLRIPNLNVMQVNTKVHEAMVGRIRGDIRVARGIHDGFRTGLLTNPDPFTRLLSQRDDVLELIRDKYKDHEYYTAKEGQRATIRVDAIPDVTFPGRVRSVAGVASQTDSWISDVKLYQTLVLIEGKVDGLKPDMTAEVTIHVDGVQNVLTVPIQAVIGGAEMGAKRKLFVKAGNAYEEKEVTLGLYNDKMVEVREGLNEGDEIVINPKVLLGDNKTKTRDTENGKGGEGKGYGGDGKGFGGEGKGFDPTKGGGGEGGKKGGKKGAGGGGAKGQGPPG
jgi:multidrug efflux pump subunit AcrA (membrane-fusion protein)